MNRTKGDWKNDVRVKATIQTHHMDDISGTLIISCSQKVGNMCEIIEDIVSANRLQYAFN